MPAPADGYMAIQPCMWSFQLRRPGCRAIVGRVMHVVSELGLEKSVKVVMPPRGTEVMRYGWDG